ncbi:bromodomain-containing protein [Nitritalea halalkaliphila]|uniref:hypothetical protein n=1 Tax=Nitritalea halalkaliphila TaxID=590849 RepID=UPI0013893C6A|nr:hypothetical protein [Nitritalea halalkaliphila]
MEFYIHVKGEWHKLKLPKGRVDTLYYTLLTRPLERKEVSDEDLEQLAVTYCRYKFKTEGLQKEVALLRQGYAREFDAWISKINTIVKNFKAELFLQDPDLLQVVQGDDGKYRVCLGEEGFTRMDLPRNPGDRVMPAELKRV